LKLQVAGFFSNLLAANPAEVATFCARNPNQYCKLRQRWGGLGG